MLTEVSHTGKQILYDFSYLWNLSKQKNKLIDTGNRLVVVRGERVRVGQDGRKGSKGKKIKINKVSFLIYIKIKAMAQIAKYIFVCNTDLTIT